MLKRIRSQTVFLYSLKVWLTSALIGPALWFFLPGIFHMEHTVSNFLYYYSYALLVVFMFSFPSFLLLIIGMRYVERRPWKMLSKRLVIAGWALILAIIPFLVTVDWYGWQMGISAYLFVAAYIAPLLVAVFLFRWPEKREG